MAQRGGHYAALGLPRDASHSDVRRAYHRIALAHHPDRLPPDAAPQQRAAAEERFKAAAAAWEVLGDPAARRLYDAGRSGAACLRDAAEVFDEFFGAAAGGGAPARLSRVEAVMPDEVFNLPLFEGYLVIDPRGEEERARGGVATALPLPAPAGGAALDLAAWARGVADDVTHDHCSPVVVMGDEGGAAVAEALRASLAAGPSDELRAAFTGPYDPVVDMLRRLYQGAERVWLVRGGTAAVLACYPVLAAGWGEPAPVPHHVAPGLYLGSRAVAILGHDRRHLREGLGITHMLVSEHWEGWERTWSPPPGEPARRVDAAASGIDVVRVDVGDGSDMAAAWDEACRRIADVHAAGGTVLVSVKAARGGWRSPSASVVLAWMCLAHGVRVPAAAHLLQRRCRSIDWRQVFPEQLLDWEKARLARRAVGAAAPASPADASPAAAPVSPAAAPASPASLAGAEGGARRGRSRSR